MKNTKVLHLNNYSFFVFSASKITSFLSPINNELNITLNLFNQPTPSFSLLVSRTLRDLVLEHRQDLNKNEKNLEVSILIIV